MDLKDNQLQMIQASRLVAILRANKGEHLVEAIEALVRGGIKVVEITFTVPKAHRLIEEVSDHFGDRILLGAGTVLDAETARIALLAGAQFLVTPAVRPEVIEMCRRYSKAVMAGAFTPTEVLTAWEKGADFVKVFPCEIVGPTYLKALKGPFPQIRLIPTGGISAVNAGAYLEAGAAALGVGGTLVPPQAILDCDIKTIEARARELVQAVRSTPADS